MAALRREDIEKLPVEERLRIIDQLWESIREDPENLPLTEPQRMELDRSLKAYESDPGKVKDLEEVLANLRLRS